MGIFVDLQRYANSFLMAATLAGLFTALLKSAAACPDGAFGKFA
jgi:hypothetical protein